jgi:DNA polymerase III epsilon subunit-like protein
VETSAISYRVADFLKQHPPFQAMDHADLIDLARNTSAVAVHGVTRDEGRAGVEEPEALARFLDYLGDGVIVGHHIDHDIITFDSAYERHWGFRMSNRSLDTMDLTLRTAARRSVFSARPFWSLPDRDAAGEG